MKNSKIPLLGEERLWDTSFKTSLNPYRFGTDSFQFNVAIHMSWVPQNERYWDLKDYFIASGPHPTS